MSASWILIRCASPENDSVARRGLTLRAEATFSMDTCSMCGSVSTRASKYSLCSRTCGDVSSCGFQDGQHGRGPPEVEQSLAVGGNMLVMAGAEAEKVAQFIVG